MTDQERSHWAWGYASGFGTAEDRRGIAQMAAVLLGATPAEPQEPVAEADVELPEPRLQAPSELAHILTDERGARIRHTYGRSFPDVYRGFCGDFRGAPDLVARPATEPDLEALMGWAAAEHVALIPFGGGTSVVSGVSPDPQMVDEEFGGWISVDMGAFDAIGPLNEVDRTVSIGAGAKGPAIEEALSAQGMTLRHFPQSFEFSTLGGWLATRAGGHFATNYTRIDDLVQSLRLISPRGVWDTPDLPSTGAGPDPRQLLLGSEGTLGFITSAVMKVRPRPVYRSRADVLFDDLDAGVAAARHIAQAHLFPANCRLLDRHEALINGVNADSKHVLLLGFESADVPVDHLLEQALQIALDAGGTSPRGPRHSQDEPARGGDAASRWRQAFLDAPYLQARLLSAGIVADTFETATTWERFPALHEDLHTTLRTAMKDVAGNGRLSLRFTHVYPDGPAPYYTFVFAPPAGADTLAAWTHVRTASADVLAKHGATITHHHAVGRFHMPWWQKERSPAFQIALQAVKTALDPTGILNPGVFSHLSAHTGGPR